MNQEAEPTEPHRTLSKSTFDRLAEIRYQLRRFIRFSEHAARSAGITPQQHQLLLAIKGFPGREHATPAELAERLQIRHNACVGLVNRSEQCGLVHRSPHPDDHRSVFVHLSGRGERILEKLSHTHLEELRRIGIWAEVTAFTPETNAEASRGCEECSGGTPGKRPAAY
jgi:DNA-binding MarR family transcriptional regulator